MLDNCILSHKFELLHERSLSSSLMVDIGEQINKQTRILSHALPAYQRVKSMTGATPNRPSFAVVVMDMCPIPRISAYTKQYNHHFASVVIFIVIARRSRCATPLFGKHRLMLQCPPLYSSSVSPRTSRHDSHWPLGHTRHMFKRRATHFSLEKLKVWRVMDTCRLGGSMYWTSDSPPICHHQRSLGTKTYSRSLDL